MSLVPEFFPEIEGFQWDDGNSEKNWARHGVTRTEAEQVFLNRPLIVARSVREGIPEARYFALGRTDSLRDLTIVFALRERLIRVISARPMSRAERSAYGSRENT
jgi:uncharacterized DUF497 family protein